MPFSYFLTIRVWTTYDDIKAYLIDRNSTHATLYVKSEETSTWNCLYKSSSLDCIRTIVLKTIDSMWYAAEDDHIDQIEMSLFSGDNDKCIHDISHLVYENGYYEVATDANRNMFPNIFDEIYTLLKSAEC
jgi:hypothetical protein